MLRTFQELTAKPIYDVVKTLGQPLWDAKKDKTKEATIKTVASLSVNKQDVPQGVTSSAVN